jgi:hypothetical protein
MGKIGGKKISARIGLAFLILAVPTLADAGLSVQGLSVQGLSVQGLSVQGLSVQGLSVQGLSVQGLSVQGLSVQGLSVQGLSVQGLSVQGLSVQGLSVQGLSVQGLSVQGTDLVGSEYKGVTMTSVDIRGTNGTDKTKVAYTLTNVPTMSSGPGNYISVGGGSAVGHYAAAHMLDAQGNAVDDLDLYIASEAKDPAPNLFHRAQEQDSQDELYVVYFFHKWSGQWVSLCPYHTATGMASAMALPEDPGDPNKFIFACTATGVAAKCARGWGYRPWAETTAYDFNPAANFGAGAWEPKTFKLRDYYNVCKDAAQASYCQDGRSYTKNGTQVDLFDTRQIIWPNAIENPWNTSNDASLWMMAQEYFISQDHLDPPQDGLFKSALQRTRYKELSPIGDCANISYIDRLEHDHIEDGRWASPSTNTPRIQIFSPTSCTHDEYDPIHHEPLPWDCSPCTTQVCKTMPECCGAGPTPAWSGACVAQAAAVCQDGGIQWPAGKVWPRDLPTDDQSVYPAYLFGPGGAVLRADGVSGSSTSATITGWACDPQWAGGTVAIEVYGGGPRENGGTLLGTVRADQALASPLAREVSAACDGPGRAYARHGFSFTLPNDQAGNVFVYAIDESTVNGPAAPPTLIRNGIVHVPRCEHSEHVAGGALSETCSACAASVCHDGTHGSCCSSSWDDNCAAAADACASADSSAPANSRSYAAITTGWIEAPVDGSYTFEASREESRLFINGATVFDWFQTSPGTKSGSITLAAGQKYAFRWDSFQAEPPGPPNDGLTWQVPGTVGQATIPTANLYAIAPGMGTGLTATYYTLPAFAGATLTRPNPDPTIDINKDVLPPGSTKVELPAGYGPSYSARWEGEIVPPTTENYTFTVVGSGTGTLYINGASVSPVAVPPSSAPGGCAHSLCQVGEKLDASCNSCVATICAATHDPYCCDGGYLSYYSFEPEWDARCIAEVETYCAPAKCTDPIAPPPGVSPQKKFVEVPLQAGVHYAIRFDYDNASLDLTARLLWASPSVAKQAIPQTALYPKASAPAAAGSGLNVAYFGTTTVANEVFPDLTTAVAGGMVADLSLAPTTGQLGTPLVEVLAAPVDASSGKPSPPSLVGPRYAEEVFVTGAMTTHVTGIGGIYPGWVHIAGGGGADVTVAVGANGDFAADLPVTLGAHTLTLVQLTHDPGVLCTPPNPCTESKTITWPITVTLETASPKAPVILSPKDLTHDANGAPLQLNVIGHGTSGAVHITDQGFFPSANPDVPANAQGKFSGHITLDNGTAAEPLRGWHKLLFDQGGTASAPVFVSVGINPPTVEFPRSGAELHCDQPDHSPPPATGTIPYPEEKLGPLRVMEETGRKELRDFGAKTRIIQPQQGSGDPIRFESNYSGVGPGRHVLLFFQAPEPPANADRDEFFRAFSSIADTPTSRIVVNVPPPRFPIPQGFASVLGGRGFTGALTNLPPPTGGPGQFPINITNCGPNAIPPASTLCAQPSADVNVRVGPRLYTTRATPEGAWSLALPLAVGWNSVTFAQVLDSAVGGAWQESCLSNEIDLGIRQAGGPIITVPLDITDFAAGPQGTVETFNVTAADASGAPVAVDCTPASGSKFPIGRTAVLCTATDPATGAVGLGELAVTVVDGPPTIKADNLNTLEATGPAGTTLNAYTNVSVFDAVDPTPALECIPAVPHLFLLDQTMPVTCTVTDSLNQTASADFTVRVVDTTPPSPCKMKDLKVGTNSGSGAIVKYDVCLASDIVDGSIPMTCDRPSGSFFPLGTTVVTCAATDKHANPSAPTTFTVEVGDTTPPVLKLPGTITAIATSKNGAKVTYTVTATDNVDPRPAVKCNPPSGALFPLGPTPVTCTATDSSGNVSQGTFIVRVIVKWSGLLPPIPADGSGVFDRGSTIPAAFMLTGESAQIYDLVARLFVAPVDAAGNVGAEKPAKSRPPSKGNVFSFIGIAYQLNLDTTPTGMAAGRWQLRVDLGDGEPHPTLIRLR